MHFNNKALTFNKINAKNFLKEFIEVFNAFLNNSFFKNKFDYNQTVRTCFKSLIK